MLLSLPDESHTAALAADLAAVLHSADVVLLHGDLGAGKTTLVRHLGDALGVLERVRSPTYTVAHSYELASGGTLAHLDLYRHETALGDAAWGDIEPYLDATYACIEWPDAGADRWVGRSVWRIELELLGVEQRLASVQAPDAARGRQLVDVVAARLGRAGVVA